MSQLRKNKEFIMEYINTVSGKVKSREMLEKYNADPGLVDNILFFDSIFPAYLVCIDEILAEGDRVMVRARLKGRHQGAFLGIEATGREVEVPYVVGYEIQNNKIIHSWLIADNLAFVEQLKEKDHRVTNTQTSKKENQNNLL
jgi:predicted ester cyclase